MTTVAKCLSGFLLLQNMKLRDYIRFGVANRLLAAEDAERLARIETLNLREIARWGRDLSCDGSGFAPASGHSE